MTNLHIILKTIDDLEKIYKNLENSIEELIHKNKKLKIFPFLKKFNSDYKNLNIRKKRIISLLQKEIKKIDQLNEI